MAPEGIKLPSDSTMASQKIRRSSSAPLDAPMADSKKASQSPPPNPLATVVLQSKAILEGRRSELFQLLLQNDPKSAPPIKIYADTNISPGTPLLLELDAKGQYQPVDSPSHTQIGKLIELGLDFWQAHLFPKAASNSKHTLPATDTLVALAKQFPQLKPLIQWLVQRPSQLNSQIIRQLLQENSPLSSLREFTNTQSSKQFSLSQSPTATEQGKTNAPTLAIDPLITDRTRVKTLLNSLVSSQVAGRSPSAINLNPLVINQLGLAQGTQIGTVSINTLTPKTPIQAFLKFAFALPMNTSEAKPASGQFGEAFVSSAIRSKQWAPMVGLLPTVSPRVLSNYIAEQNQNIKAAVNTGIINQGTTANQMFSNPSGNNQFSALASAPMSTGDAATTTMSTFRQMTNELLSLTLSKTNQAQQTASSTASNLIEIKLGQWLALIEQVQAKDSSDLAYLLKSKAMNILSGQADSSDKIQSDPRLQSSLSQPDKENALNQLRSWVEATQAKVLHQAVQAASAQWQTPDLPVIQQMQLPLIWLGLTSWADIEWWQEKKKKESDDEAEEKSKRRWRMRIYLNVAPLSEFCADIDWHPNDTHLVFWSEDSTTLAHLNTLVPTLKEWTQGLSNESIIQTRHGMPKRASEQQLKRTNHHLVDVKT
ncbi:hypothetical protein [Reinekea sp.]|jgi:hypothetical protein|uniref:hypothetical protein n=1 Tax=Reinekea sp. TaxID=1970455 RepID=UPI00398913D4